MKFCRFSHEQIEFTVEDSLRASLQSDPAADPPPPPSPRISTIDSSAIANLRSRRKSVEDEMEAIGDLDETEFDLEGSIESSSDDDGAPMPRRGFRSSYAELPDVPAGGIEADDS